jgi:hypothetical protein
MKKNFNIVCNVFDVDSYQGNIYDAQFAVNFGTLIDDEDYKKRYKITLRLKTAIDADILTTQTYICNLIVNSKVYSQQNLGLSYTLGILNKNIDDITTGIFSLDASPNDNPPLVISTLDKTSTIGLRFNILETGGLFTLMPNYIAILNFEEID